jgi:hypothetical protein
MCLERLFSPFLRHTPREELVWYIPDKPSACTSVKFIFAERAVTFILLLFPKLFASAAAAAAAPVHLCQRTVVINVYRCDFRAARLRNTHRRPAHFRGVNYLCRTRVVKKQLLAATVFANRARRSGEGLPGVYLAEADEESERERPVDSQRK